MAERPDLLCFLEDPGAANYARDFPSAFGARGMRVRFAALGPAALWLRERGFDFIALGSGEEALRVLAESKPRAVALGTADNPQALNLALAGACHAAGIPSAAFVDGYGNLERRFAGPEGPLQYAPDWILVPDAESAQRYAALGFPRERLRACGHPGLEKVVEEGERLRGRDRAALRKRLFPDAPAGSQIVIFVAEISRTPDPSQYRKSPQYTLEGSGRFDRRVEIVLEESLSALGSAGARPYFVLRLHPKNTSEEFAPFAASVDQISRGGSAHEWVYAADAVIGLTSLLLIEAAYLGCPTLSVIPQPSEAEWLWTVRAGVTPCAWTPAQVAHEVRALWTRLQASGPCGALSVDPRLPDPRGALERHVDFFESLPKP